MTIENIYQVLQNKQKMKYILIICIASVYSLNIILDYLFSQFHNSNFYISESLLFSSFWILFFPFLHIQSKIIEKNKKINHNFLFTIILIIIHLLCYPAIIWVLSKLFYYHTFSYSQTFNFCLSAYFIKTVLIYFFSLIFLSVLKNKPQNKLNVELKKSETYKFISSIMICDKNNKKMILMVNDIFYFSANSPYITIHHISKKFLYSNTLKVLENQLDNNQFVRIHKSHIVNIEKIISIKSRQNGDYDLMLSDNSVLRLSRSYAKTFKFKFGNFHQVTT